MQQPIYRYISIAAVLLSVLIWFSPSRVMAQETEKKAEVTESDLIDGKSSYIKGLEEFENGNYEKALDLLNEAYVKLPKQAGVSFALADVYFQMEDLSNAAFYGKQAAQMDPENKWYHLKLADIYRQMGKNQATIDELKTALKYHPNDSDILYDLANVYSQHGEYLKSNNVYNQLLRLTGPDIGIHLQKLRNFNELGIRDSSIAELQKIQELDPDNLSTLQMLSNYYRQVNKKGQAKKMLEKALKKNSRDPQSLVMLAEIYVEESQWDSVSTLLGNVITDPIIEREAKMEIARYLYTQYQNNPGNDRLATATESVVELFIEHEPEYAGSHALASDFYLSQNNNRKALLSLEKTTELRPDNEEAWLQRLQLLLQEGRFDEVVSAGKKADEHIPQNPFVQYYIGSAYQQMGSNKQAIPYLEQATELPARKFVKSIFYGALGDSYSAMDNWDNAFSAYEESIKLDPNNATALNNYAYYLSLKGDQLDKAEEMAKKAINLAENDSNATDASRASYFDTLGWIYYKKEDYETARQYIQRSLDLGSTSAEVMEHMGDVMDKLNRPNKAREWWQKALKQDPSRTYLKERLSQS